MDPLTTSAALVGLLSSLSKTLRHLSSFSSLPVLGQSLQTEALSLTTTIALLNNFIKQPVTRMSMTTVEQFVTVLTHLILAVGELEEGVDLVKVAQRPGTQERPMSAEEIGGWDREMWEKKEEDMRGLYEDLQRIRGCWEVMMAGWGSKTNSEAMQTQEEIISLISEITTHGSRRSSNIRSTKHLSVDTKSLRRTSILSRGKRGSVVSLNEVRDIASIQLPVYAADVYNSTQYTSSSGSNSNSRPKRNRRMTWSASRGISLVTMITALWRPPQQSKTVMSIGEPYNMKHTTHIGIDPENGKMQVLGQEVCIPFRISLTTPVFPSNS
ncbi:hypothetical protein FPQ18DRAFT_390592 [Pyronema domesticum]|nr:hypothetical protein FPQ18DRAFT_390592 [Pyronema domesticum]